MNAKEFEKQISDMYDEIDRNIKGRILDATEETNKKLDKIISLLEKIADIASLS